MHTGRFQLEKTTLAIGDGVDGKRVAVRMPAGDTVKLIADPRPGNKMVDVLWEGRTVAMYAVDLNQRGIETQSRRPLSDYLPPQTR